MKKNKLTLMFIALAMIGATGCKEKGQATAKGPAPTSAADLIYTAPLTPAERQEFYHLPEGGELLSLSMLRAVESVRTFKPFMENLDRFRLIGDPADPDGLPVGMSATLKNGVRTSPRMVFFNCAACHTTELTYHGKTLRIDGAPSHFDLVGFIAELLQSLDSTLASPERMSVFLRRVNFRDELPASSQQLQSALEVTRLLSEKIRYLSRLRALRPTTTPGFGRLDAFVGARDLLFGEKYALDVNSPVSLPPIFGLKRLSFYHYDNNTNSILQRNIGEDLGVGAVADPNTGESTVQVRSLVRLEAHAAKLPVPRWPVEIFGVLDAARVRRGATLYQKECASCHDADPAGRFPDRVISREEIGTDANRSLNFGRPVGEQPFAHALAAVLDRVEKSAFTREAVTAAEITQLEPPQVIWRTTNGYAVRPLDGVWATAPYLHNGSVPTLYDLLLPPAQRPKTFLTGSREFDTKKVGYVNDGAAGATFLLDTAADGNHNTGHTYGTTLTDEQRMDLIEYLKSR